MSIRRNIRYFFLLGCSFLADISLLELYVFLYLLSFSHLVGLFNYRFSLYSILIDLLRLYNCLCLLGFSNLVSLFNYGLSLYNVLVDLLRLYDFLYLLGFSNLVSLFNYGISLYSVLVDLLRLYDFLYVFSFSSVINLLFCDFLNNILGYDVVILIGSILLGKRENAIILSHDRLINFFDSRCICLSLDHDLGNIAIIILKCFLALLFSSCCTLKGFKRLRLLLLISS